jgi:hypothetical protein
VRQRLPRTVLGREPRLPHPVLAPAQITPSTESEEADLDEHEPPPQPPGASGPRTRRSRGRNRRRVGRRPRRRPADRHRQPHDRRPTQAPFVGDTLTGTPGRWSGSPTKYGFQWDRCDPVGDRRGCAPISGASSAKYAVKKDDVNHTLRVRVTATNASGSTTKDSKGTGVVSDANKPSTQSRPKIAGSANIGSTLTADTGTWAGATSFSYE